MVTRTRPTTVLLSDAVAFNSFQRFVQLQLAAEGCDMLFSNSGRNAINNFNQISSLYSNTKL